MKYLIALFVAMWCVMVAPVQAEQFPKNVYFVCAVQAYQLNDDNFDPNMHCSGLARMNDVRILKYRGVAEDLSYSGSDLVFILYYAEPVED